MKHFLVCYIGGYDILSQQIKKIQAYHRKTCCNFSVTLHRRKKNIFCQAKLQTIIIKVVLSKFFDSKLDILPKTYQGVLAILKSPLKLLITSSYIMGSSWHF